MKLKRFAWLIPVACLIGLFAWVYLVPEEDAARIADVLAAGSDLTGIAAPAIDELSPEARQYFEAFEASMRIAQAAAERRNAGELSEVEAQRLKDEAARDFRLFIEKVKEIQQAGKEGDR